MIKINVEQGSEAWHDIRCGRITGSRFSNLMMGDSTKGYKDLILDIVGELLTSKQEETYTNDNMERGKELEPEARREYESIFGPVEQVGFVIPDEENKYYDLIGVSPDGLTTDGGLEIKCPLRKTHLGYIAKGELPNEYKYQVQSSLFVTGLDWWDFMSYYPDMKPFIIRIYPDFKMFQNFVVELDKVWDSIKQKLNEYSQYNYLDIKL